MAPDNKIPKENLSYKIPNGIIKIIDTALGIEYK